MIVQQLRAGHDLSHSQRRTVVSKNWDDLRAVGLIASHLANLSRLMILDHPFERHDWKKALAFFHPAISWEFVSGFRLTDAQVEPFSGTGVIVTDRLTFDPKAKAWPALRAAILNADVCYGLAREDLLVPHRTLFDLIEPVDRAMDLEAYRGARV